MSTFHCAFKLGKTNQVCSSVLRHNRSYCGAFHGAKFLQSQLQNSNICTKPEVKSKLVPRKLMQYAAPAAYALQNRPCLTGLNQASLWEFSSPDFRSLHTSGHLPANTTSSEKDAGGEEEECEERKYQLFIHNLCESDHADRGVRLQYDRSQLERLLDIIGAGDVKVKSFKRLGSKREEGEAIAKPRLILLAVHSDNDLKKVLKCAKITKARDWKGEYLYNDFANVYIHANVSRAQYLKRTNLRKEMITRMKNGETDLVIYAGKIMKRSELKKIPWRWFR